MARYKIREVIFKDFHAEPGQLVTVAEAAKMTGMSLSGVIAAGTRGVLREVIDVEQKKSRQDRRYYIRRDVEAFAKRRKSD
jgi:hypothetical protein